MKNENFSGFDQDFDQTIPPAELRNVYCNEGSDNDLRFWPGCRLALYEIIFGLHRMFPQKKKILYHKKSEFFLNQLETELLRLGLDCRGCSDSEIERVLFSEGRETLCVLASRCDVLTGIDFLEESSRIADACLKSKVFYLEIRDWPLDSGEVLKPLECHILRLNSWEAWVAHGPRFRRVAHFLGRFWPPPRDLTSGFPHQDKKRVQELESHLPGDFFAPIAGRSYRLWNRLVFSHPYFDGSAVLELLEKEGHLIPGFSWTSSLCYHRSFRFYDFLKNIRGWSEERLRGTFVIRLEGISPRLSAQKWYDRLATISYELEALQGKIEGL